MVKGEGGWNVVGEKWICYWGVCGMDFRFERMGGIVVAGVMKDYVGCFRWLSRVQCCAIVGGTAHLLEMGFELLSVVSDKRAEST